MKTRSLVYLFLLICCLEGCYPEDCLSTKTLSFGAGFYHTENGEEYEIEVSFIKPENSDSLLSENVVANTATLVLNPSDTMTVFVFQFITYERDTLWLDPPDNTEIDTVRILSVDTLNRAMTFSYKKSQRIISPECGVEQAVSHLKVLDHDFDSVAVVDDVLDRFDEQNVEIYF